MPKGFLFRESLVRQLVLLFSLLNIQGGFCFSPNRNELYRLPTAVLATETSSTYAAPIDEIDRRRNLAIISHPDSGKTTMTEKLLLYGGAIQQAGAVRQKAEQRGTASDFMEMEKERGISISSTVMNFDYNALKINILDVCHIIIIILFTAYPHCEKISLMQKSLFCFVFTASLLDCARRQVTKILVRTHTELLLLLIML